MNPYTQDLELEHIQQVASAQVIVHDVSEPEWTWYADDKEVIHEIAFEAFWMLLDTVSGYERTNLSFNGFYEYKLTDNGKRYCQLWLDDFKGMKAMSDRLHTEIEAASSEIDKTIKRLELERAAKTKSLYDEHIAALYALMGE